MSKKKKYKQKNISLDNLSIAKTNVSILSNEEINDMIDPLYLSVKKIYVENITSDTYIIIATIIALARELENHSSVKGFSSVIDSASHSLIEIQKRCNSTGKWIDGECYKQEVHTLINFVAAHKFQLKNCTKQEIGNCAARLVSRSKSLKEIIKVKLNVDTVLEQLRQDTSQVQLSLPSFEIV